MHQDKLLAFLAKDPTSGKSYVFLPGGRIEDQETAPDAAVRETFEETGFHVSIDAWSCIERRYPFEWDSELYDSVTLFYRAKLLSPLQSPVNDASYHQGVVWIPIEEVNEVFSYSLPILEAIQELLVDDRG